ncbi:hypothetical protein HAP48_0011475 [Bradyrhizobium septentrionale]|uniref:Uncharacterized protein n=1 Tax=Bradyrhizobium septentrionale TaxID=1404411 RepID=A0A973W859_9BRAD|nr:hypothetical protein [Bradyrhizobium septentrionale]UGY17992.1 hypothetical protein HAP48_0011475 [Bradyrhizobium septentrionale]
MKKKYSLIRQIKQSEIDQIRAQLDRVRKVGKKAARSEKRFADYRYLRAVYRALHNLGEDNLLPILSRVVRQEYNVPKRAGTHALRTIIDATATTASDLRTRSRWARALEWAYDQEVRPSELIWFLKANNGIAGCARLANMGLPLYRRPRDYAFSDDLPESNGNDAFGQLRNPYRSKLPRLRLPA